MYGNKNLRSSTFQAGFCFFQKGNNGVAMLFHYLCSSLVKQREGGGEGRGGSTWDHASVSLTAGEKCCTNGIGGGFHLVGNRVE